MRIPIFHAASGPRRRLSARAWAAYSVAQLLGGLLCVQLGEVGQTALIGWPALLPQVNAGENARGRESVGGEGGVRWVGIGRQGAGDCSGRKVWLSTR